MRQECSPKEIESKLTEIWDSSQGEGKMRARLFNLIVYSKKTDRENYLHEVAERVIKKFPSRIIFVTLDEESGEDHLTTAVSVLSDEDFACDLIEITVSGNLKQRVPFVILPHLLPDLPVYMVKGDDPTSDDPISIKLERFSRRIIFDSETADDLPAFAQTVLKHKDELGIAVADLNWARIENWRILLAGIFHSKDRLGQLENSETINIHYNCCTSRFCAHTKTGALFLGIWLAEQMGWTLGEMQRQEDHILLQSSGPTIHLYPSCMKEVSAGRILGLEIKTKTDETFSIMRSKQCPEHIRIEMSTPEVCEIPTEFVMSKEAVGQSLIREIGHNGSSLHLLNVLKAVATLNSEVVS